MEDIQARLKDLKVRFQQISDQIDQDKLRLEIRELEAQTMKEGFWKAAQWYSHYFATQ